MEGGFIRDDDIDEPARPSGAPAALPFQPPADAPPALPPGPFSYSNGCSRCNSLSYSDEYYKAFGILLCNQCRRDEKLISKSTAKQRYLLTDGDIKPLGFLRRKNPQKPNWQPMQLLLESQVQEIAHAKHGGEQGIEDKARQLLDKKLQARVKRREEEREREIKEHARKERIKRKLEDQEEQKQLDVNLDDEDVEDI